MGTFGTLKQEICRMSEVPVQYQRILWRGREREDHEKLKNVGIRKNSKVILDDSAFRQYKNAQKLKNEPTAENIPVEMKIIEKIKSKIDEVESKILDFENCVTGSYKENVLQELLTQQVLSLDCVDVPAGAVGQNVRDARKQQIVRVHQLSTRIEKSKDH